MVAVYSKFRTFLSESFGGGISSRLTYKLILVLALAEILLMMYLSGWKGYDTADTMSYYYAFEEISELRPNSWRTPVYPLIFGGIWEVAGETIARIIVVLLQVILFFVSLAFLRRSCDLLWKNEKLTYLIVAVYSLWPPVPSLTCSLLTEGMAIPLTVVLTFFFLRAIKSQSWKLMSVIGILSIFLVFLRPSFLFLLLFIPFWGILICLRRFSRASLYAAVASVITASLGWMLVCCYTNMMEREYGVPVFTQVADYNSYFLLRESGALSPETVTNPECRELVESYLQKENYDIYEGYEELVELSAKMDAVEFYEMIRENMNIHKMDILKGLVDRTYRTSQSRLNYLGLTNRLSHLIAPFSINFGFYFIIVVVIFGAIVLQFFCRNDFPVLTFLIWSLSISITFVAIAGAMNDWARLVSNGQCLWMMLLGSIFNCFKQRRPIPKLP